MTKTMHTYKILFRSKLGLRATRVYVPARDQFVAMAGDCYFSCTSHEARALLQFLQNHRRNYVWIRLYRCFGISAERLPAAVLERIGAEMERNTANV